MFKYQLGAEAKDVVTGFKGIIMGRTQYFTGCIQYGLCPRKLDSDGKTKGWSWFDEDRIRIIGNGLLSKPRPIGGPQDSVAPDR